MEIELDGILQIMDIGSMETKASKNFKLVNNTGVDTRMFDAVLLKAVDNKKLPDEFEDIFTLTILEAYNPDGSDRGILEMA